MYNRAVFVLTYRWTEQVVMDANCPVDTMQALGEICVSAGVPLWYEPTSIPKSGRVLQAPAALQAIKWISPNLHELSAMAEAAIQPGVNRNRGALENLNREVAAAVQGLSLPNTDTQQEMQMMESSLGAILHAMVGKDGNSGTFSITHPISPRLLTVASLLSRIVDGAYGCTVVRRPDAGRQTPHLRISWVYWPALGGRSLVADWSGPQNHHHGALSHFAQTNHIHIECVAHAR